MPQVRLFSLYQCVRAWLELPFSRLLLCVELCDERQPLQALGWRLERSSVQEEQVLGVGEVRVFYDVLEQ